METLEQVSEAAEAYYRTGEYLALVDEMRQHIAAVRRQVIAVDLEGTLVSGNLAVTTGDDTDFELAYLRRPLANEFLKALATAGNRAMLWTAATKTIADRIISLTGLQLPKGTRIISQDETKLAMHNSGLITAELRDIRPKYAQAAKAGLVKIPALFGVDLLLDDQSRFHRAFCRLLGKDDDTQKIVFVYPFGQFPHGVIGSHQDGELNEVAKILAARSQLVCGNSE